MARIESISIGGYYATPERVVPLLADLFRVDLPEGKDPRYTTHSYMDPCAGDGAAVTSFMQALHGTDRDALQGLELYTAELEASRFEALKANSAKLAWRWGTSSLHGDAFRIVAKPCDGAGVSLLYLNPPYDFDPEVGRLEERFLSRFTGLLATGGVLVFLVPFYALKASARTLAQHYSEVFCYRFPDPEFNAYKQVALVALKQAVPLLEPDPTIEARVLAWAKDADSLPVLGASPQEKIRLVHHYRGLESWNLATVDLTGLVAKIRPWMMTDRSGKAYRVPGILPEGAIEDLLVRQYPVAMPPRSAHIAAGIAAGVFNGARIEPDDEESALPPLLVKGVFDKEFRTVKENIDDRGNVKGLVQVQQPKLVTTVLDLRENCFITIEASPDVTGAQDIESMTMGDLLASYGRGLMDVMLRQCPVLHNPARPEDEIPLPEVLLPLYKAQSHTTQAAVKLLGGLDVSKTARRFKSAFVLGEIGSGKTAVALTTAQAIRVKRTLVLCPPHLLQSWCDQIEMVVPWLTTVILNDIGDVQELAANPDERPILAILSRETAKLGHGVAGISGLCPRCGAPIDSRVDHGKKRSRCGTAPLLVKDAVGHAIYDLALALLPVFPRSHRLRILLRTRPLQNYMDRQDEEKDFSAEAWSKATERFPAIVDVLTQDDREPVQKALMALLVAHPERSVVLRVARKLLSTGRGDIARNVLCLINDGPDFQAVIDEAKAAESGDKPSYYSDPWVRWEAHHRYLWTGEVTKDYYWNSILQREKDGTLLWEKHVLGTTETALEAIAFAQHSFYWGPECQEPLFQAIPEPRRYPVATFIARKYPDLFDLLILDEGHEYATDGSAQERAAHRLMARGTPTLLLTGSIMNGYAESMFTNMWSMSNSFRQEFERNERTAFVDRYGYRKRLVEDRDKESGEIVAYGSVTDRVERTERMMGNAPGVLPIFLLRHLLPNSVTLHKTDLSVDIPKCTESTVTVPCEGELFKRYNRLKDALVAQIKKDRFDPERAGKLWGALADLPSYLDLATADTGNREGGTYSIRYPESVGGELIAEAEPFPASTLLPKEAWMLEHVKQSLEEGRNVLVFAWHTVLLPRLARLIEGHLGVKCPILDPTKVPTKKRQAWIDAQVIAKGYRVLVVNPVTVQTGLNNLVYFSDELWMENPACNPTIYRQAKGRVDRIRQTRPTRILFPLYEKTTQPTLHSLLMLKVAVSMATDGLDAEGAMVASGIGDNTGLSSFAVGRQLYEILTNPKQTEPRRSIVKSTLTLRH